MGVSYNKLFDILDSRGLKKYYLRKNGLNPKVVDALSKNKNVNVSTIIELCKLLNCQPGDIMEYVPDIEQSEPKTEEPKKNTKTKEPEQVKETDEKTEEQIRASTEEEIVLLDEDSISSVADKIGQEYLGVEFSYGLLGKDAKLFNDITDELCRQNPDKNFSISYAVLRVFEELMRRQEDGEYI